MSDYKPNEAIYSELIAAMTLNDADRAKLKNERGFTDTTIDTLQFKSACPANAEIVEHLVEKYGLASMFECSLIDQDRKPVYQVTRDGMVVIPYLRHDLKSVYFLKSHKYGNLTGIPSMPYCDKLMATMDDTIILCESEYKAAAMWQMGYRALGLGGVATFTGEHLPELVKMVNRVNKVIILFDTEIKDDPLFKNYKQDFRSRYAQFIWSYILGKRLEMAFKDSGQDGPRVLIASLPESWMEENKADIDGCLARGKSRADFDAILRDAIEPGLYRKYIKIPPEHVPWVNKRMDVAFKTRAIYDKFNCYYTLITRPRQDPYEKQISNFTMQIVNNVMCGKEMHRDIAFVNQYQQRATLYDLKPEQISSSNAFKTACVGLGEFTWSGNDQQLTTIFDTLFLDTDTVPVHMLDLIGRDESRKVWFFENMAIRDDGSEYVPDDEATFKIGSEGVRIQPLSKNSLPSLSKEPMDIPEIIKVFHDGWGIPGLLAFCYAVSSIFSNPIFAKYRSFPFALIYGERNSGKTTLSDAMCSLLGFPQHNVAMNISGTTQVAVMRNLAYYSSLPCRFDELRNDKKTEDKQSIMRSIFNRQAESKGLRATFGVREVEVKGTFCLIGEERPSDPALRSRCIPMYTVNSHKTQGTYDAAKWLFERSPKLSYVAYHLIKNYVKFSEQILADMDATRQGLAKLATIETDFRTQTHYAMVMAALGLVLPVEKAAAYMKEFVDGFKKYSSELDRESVLYKFFEDIGTMQATGVDTSRFMVLDGGHAVIYLQGLYAEWFKWKMQHGGIKSLMTDHTIKEYFLHQPYVKKKNIKRFLPDITTRCNCHSVDVNDTSLPGTLKDWIEHAADKIYNPNVSAQFSRDVDHAEQDDDPRLFDQRAGTA